MRSWVGRSCHHSRIIDNLFASKSNTFAWFISRYFIPFFYVPTYAQTQLHTTPLVGSILVAVMDLGVSMGRILIGRMADSRIGTMNSIIISMAISGLCQLALWLPASKSLALLYVFSFVYGFFGGSIG